MSDRAARAYTAFAGLFLAAQGASTLAALTFPVIDKTFPWLLGLTRMVPIHSSLHLLTAVVAFIAFRLGYSRAFAIGFGLFYTGLAIVGWVTGAQLCLSLQPFDHPFHLVLGGLGVVAAAIDMRRPREVTP